MKDIFFNSFFLGAERSASASLCSNSVAVVESEQFDGEIHVSAVQS